MKLKKYGQDGAGFLCPGCKGFHFVRICGSGAWGFNGDFENPTLTPSIKVTDHTNRICHSFVTDGKIRFLGDCTHNLKGQTVDLPDISEQWELI